ncbi:MAG: DMT family transporter [Chloroflexota bacterium]
MRQFSVAPAISLSGLAFVLVSASAFAMQGLFAKLAYHAGASTPTVGLGRFGATALMLWGYALIRNRGGNFPLRLPGRSVVILLGLGAVAYFLGSLTYLGAVAYSPVSLAGLLLYTYPAIATLVVAWLGRERVTATLGAGVVTALIGVAVTLGGPALAATRSSDWRGILLVLSSAGLYAGYTVGSQSALRGVHSVLAMAYISSGAATSFALLTLLTRTLTPSIGPAGFGWIFGMALVSTVVAAGTFLAALRRLGPSRAATISTVEPLITVLFAGIILGERLEPIQLAGGLVILLGVLLVLQERRSAEADDAIGGSVTQQPLTQ